MARTVLVIVAGSSGAGKTRLSRTLGDRLAWPVIARDDLKEVLLDAFPPADREGSMRLGGPSWPLMYAVLDRLIGRVPGIIVEANFRAGRSEAELLPRVQRCETIYLHCIADWESVSTRLRARTDDPARHPGHFDAEAFSQVRADWQDDAYRPMELGAPVVLVRTDAMTADGYDPALDDLLEIISNRVP